MTNASGKIKLLATVYDGQSIDVLVGALRKNQLLAANPDRDVWFQIVDRDRPELHIYERVLTPTRPRLHDYATVKGEPEKSMNRSVRVSSIDEAWRRCYVSNRDGTIMQFVPFDAFEYDEDTGKWTVAVPGYGSTPLPPPPPIVNGNLNVAGNLDRYTIVELEEALGMLDSLAAEQLTGDAAKRRDNAKLLIARELLDRGVMFW